MKKLAIALLFALPMGANAQGVLLGLDAGYGLPLGDFGESVNGGLGGELRARFYPKDKIMLGVNAGYYSYAFVDKDNRKISGNTSIIPVTASFEYFLFTKVVKPYIGLDAGLYNASFKQTVETSTTILGNTVTTKSENNSSESRFGIAPNVGVMIGTGGTNLNLGIKYLNIFGDENPINAVVYTLGVAFKIGM